MFWNISKSVGCRRFSSGEGKKSLEVIGCSAMY